MFDIGWSELMMVGVLAIVFVGPKDLPKLMRTLGQYTARAKSMAREFQSSFDSLAKEAELQELRNEVENIRRQAMQPLSPEQIEALQQPEEKVPAPEQLKPLEKVEC